MYKFGRPHTPGLKKKTTKEIVIYVIKLRVGVKERRVGGAGRLQIEMQL